MARTKSDAAPRARGRGRGLKRPARALAKGHEKVAERAPETELEKAKDLVEAPVETPKVETPKEEQEAELSQPQGEVGELQLEINEEKVEPIERLRSPQEDEIELPQEPNGTDSEKSESESSCGSSESDEMDEMDVSFQESSGNPQPNRPNRPNQPNLPYLVDNDSGVYFTLHQSPRRCWVHAFRWPSDHLWVRRFPGQLEKTALGQGFVAFASRRKVYVFSSGGGYPIFPPLLLEEPLLQMRLQHAFLLLLSLDGQAKVLDLAERRCLCRASLKDLCEPSLLQLDDALQMSFEGQLTLQIQNQQLRFDNNLQLWMTDGEGEKMPNKRSLG
ncbi:unnamed protein product [Cladocopium goreaui]|uniref:Uncharacterized protein n=1 Tax=Cladocopium goreaui TaxID=2562237 RepID=A0A9P1D546_9DINO|nr:unnamed protein product [Cladocopium goreaui]